MGENTPDYLADPLVITNHHQWRHLKSDFVSHINMASKVMTNWESQAFRAGGGVFDDDKKRNNIYRQDHPEMEL